MLSPGSSKWRAPPSCSMTIEPCVTTYTLPIAPASIGMTASIFSVEWADQDEIGAACLAALQPARHDVVVVPARCMSVRP